jgi:hypothetical protein
MGVKLYTIFLLTYIMMLLLRSAQKEDDKEFVVLTLGFVVWLPIIGRVFDFW